MVDFDKIDDLGTNIARHAYKLIMDLPQTDEVLQKASLGYFYAALLCAKMQIERIIGPEAVEQLKSATFLVDEQDLTVQSEDSLGTFMGKKGKC